MPPKAMTVRTRRRLILFALVGVVLAYALVQALNPYNERGLAEITHGDHVHFVPEDADPDVSLDAFPTTPPAPEERVLPDGRVVRADAQTP
jgi:hypothetical protein